MIENQNELPSLPPAMGSFTATVTAQALSAVSSGVPGAIGCNGVYVQCPAASDAGVAQTIGILVGVKNRGQSTISYGIRLEPGDAPVFVECGNTSEVYVLRGGGSDTLAKFWCRRRNNY